jgi:hypothetical protein
VIRAAVVGAVAALLATTALAGGSAVPRQLVGKYGRTISAKTLARTGFPQAAGGWTLTFAKAGTVFVQGPAAVSAYLKVASAGASRITFSDQFCAPYKKGTYAWSLSGKALKLTSVNDRCGDRATVLTGVWKRR